MKANRQMSRVILITLAVYLAALVSPACADAPDSEAAEKEQNDTSVMQAFSSKEVKKSEVVAIGDKTKRLVMFFMGVPLLLLLATTVALGIAMVIFEKKVFVAHMIFAGLSMTLAIAHAIVGVVWFYPF
jgi:hypothetical protein